MQTITTVLEAINNMVWGPGMLLLLIGTGLYLTVGMRFITVRNIHKGFLNLWRGRSSEGKGELSPFNALMTALAGTIGTGSIAGVATAIFYGGPGALFWMWLTALVGMATKFAEVLLAVHYREVTPAGNYVGGAMYFIKNGLGPRWQWLGTLFCVFTVVACFGTGNAVQCNSIAEAMLHAFGMPTWVTAGILFLLVGAVLLGGLKRIGNVAGRVVPVMAGVYILASLIVITLHYEQVPRIFMFVVMDAFSPTAASGGFAGATVMMAIRYGMARGVFSNEAGLGTAPIAHAAAETTSPMTQASIGMLDTFITTILVCSMTGFAILVTGEWTSGVAGVSMVANAFESTLPGVGTYIVSLSLSLFAFTTVLGWCVYGERCVIYLFGDKGLMPFRILYSCMVPIGATAQLGVVWLLADTVNALMAIPNLTAVLLLSPVVFKAVREHERLERHERREHKTRA